MRPMIIKFLQFFRAQLSRNIGPPIVLLLLIFSPTKSSGENTAPRLAFFEGYQQGTWTQVSTLSGGGPLYADSKVALSSDGFSAILGSPFQDREGHKGRTVIHYFDPEMNSWTQRGQAIFDQAFGDYSGSAVALSADGLTAIIGAERHEYFAGETGHVRIFHFDPEANSWTQLGQDIHGERSGDGVGASVALSADGFTAMIGAGGHDGNGENSGHARIFRFNPEFDSWIQLGQNIDGEAAGDRAGGSIALSADGLTAMVGAWGHDGNGEDSGQARIFSFDHGSNLWIQLGQDIDGEAAGDRAGSVALSADGLTAIVMAARGGNAENLGYARIFRFDHGSDSWIQLDQDTNGEDVVDWTGSVALSADGLTAIIGKPSKQVKHGIYGQVKVFRFRQETSSWMQIGQDINGVQDLLNFGTSVALSADGLTAMAGSNHNPQSLRVQGRVYRLIVPATINYDHLAKTRAVTNADALDDFDLEGTGLTYSLSGEDGALFTIEQTGMLNFLNAPDFHSPADHDSDNIYRVNIIVTDSENASTEQALTITILDDHPILSATSEITLTRNQARSMALTLSDSDTPLENLSISATSDNQELLTDASLIFTGTGPSRFLSISPIHGKIGITNITITVSDGDHTTTRTFAVRVVNTAPQLNFIGGNLTRTWTQLGQDIDGSSGEELGDSVALSADGHTAIIGALWNNHTDIFRFDQETHSWNQLGQDIENNDRVSGTHIYVDLSADGLTAITGFAKRDGSYSSLGLARIFRFDQTSNSWAQLGEDISSRNSTDDYITPVALSADGSTAIVGDPLRDSNGGTRGHVRVLHYDQNSNAWVQLGQDIEGENRFDWFGNSVDLSADGLTAIISNGSGRYYIFRYDQDFNFWTQLGQDLSSYSALSSDGLTAIIGTPHGLGHAGIFQFEQESNSWIRLEEDLNNVPDDSDTLNADGIAAITEATGQTRIFRFDRGSDSWVQLGQNIETEQSRDLSGFSVDVTAEGPTVIIGANGNDGNGAWSGHARIFRLAPPIANYSILENTHRVTDVGASDDADSEEDGLTYSLSGADAALFQVDATGILSFRVPPDFEAPTDLDADNIYQVDVIATDSQSASSQHALEIKVTDVLDTTVDISLAIETLQTPLVAGGGPLTAFQVSAKNNGPFDAQNVIITQTSNFPQGTSLVSATPSIGTFTNGNWNLDLASGVSASFTVVVQSDATATSGPNSFSFGISFASSAQVETSVDNNSALASIPIISTADITLNSTPLEFDHQSGLFTATTTITNNGTVTIPAARIFVTNLPSDVQLSNAHDTTDRGPYILLNYPITVGTQVNIGVEFSGTNQDPGFTPIYELEILPWTIIEPFTADGRITMTQSRMLMSGEPFFEIASIPGATYEIEYTSSMGSTWQKVSPQLVAETYRIPWIDNGSPKTESHPQETKNRFYRFTLISTPAPQ